MRTPYTETEALLLATEVEQDHYELLDAYLRENFLPGELRSLETAAYVLGFRCRKLLKEAGLL